MKDLSRSFARAFSIPAAARALLARTLLAPTLLTLALAGCRGGAEAVKVEGDFSSHVVDIGIVASDVERSAAFYTKALGFTEMPGFDVPASLGADAGLADSKAFHVRVFVLADAPAATKVKLMQFADAPGAKPDNAFLHSTVGFRYLTVMVSDMTAAVERAAKAGATPIAKGPCPLPKGFPEGVYLAVFRDPDGNFVEFVGPKK